MWTTQVLNIWLVAVGGSSTPRLKKGWTTPQLANGRLEHYQFTQKFLIQRVRCTATCLSPSSLTAKCLWAKTRIRPQMFVCEMCLTTVFMEDVGEAVQDPVTTATVGASFLNPLTMWNHTTGPIERWGRCRLVCLHCTAGWKSEWLEATVVYLMRWSYSQLRPVKNGGQAQKLPRMHVPPFLQQLRLCSAPARKNALRNCNNHVLTPINKFKSPPLQLTKQS